MPLHTLFSTESSPFAGKAEQLNVSTNHSYNSKSFQYIYVLNNTIF